jgi:TolA-binding protein
MSATRGIAWIALLLVGCASPDLGKRYRAERDLLAADQRYYALSALPRQPDDAPWRALAGEYADIAARTLPAADAAPDPGSPLWEQLQEIAARALFTAAQIHAALQDSVRVDQIFQQMATAFAGVPDIAGEVSLSRGRIAESRGELEEAIGCYESVVRDFQPHPGEPGIGGMVLALPLRIARLRAQLAGASHDSVHYGPARTYYRRLAEDGSAPDVAAEASAHLADIAAELGRWEEAARILQRLEQQLRGLRPRPREPAEVRFAAFEARLHVYTSLDSMQSDIESLAQDYPRHQLAPRARLAMAAELSARGQTEDALAVLDQLLRDSRTSFVVPDALLAKAQLLERQGRWKEAVSEYRSLLSGHPVSPAALRSHLEIADHYLRAGNDYARMKALDQAQRAYREFLVRYPENPYTVRAWELLIRTLTLQQRHVEAVDEMLRLSERVAGSSKEPQLLVEAARTAATQLGDTSRAIAILQQTAQRLPQTRIGTWSTHEIDRLRRGGAP